MNYKVELKYRDGLKEVHYIGPFSDVALCGQDLSGDGKDADHGGWDTAVPTRKKVNCTECLQMIFHVKNILSATPQKEEKQ